MITRKRDFGEIPCLGITKGARMRKLGKWLGRPLYGVLFLVLPAAADTVDYQVCCIIDNGFGLNSAISIPAFDPTMGQLQSATYNVQFSGQLSFQSGSSGSGPVSYSATIFPSLVLGDPLDLSFYSVITQSGTMMLQNGAGFINFSGSDQISGAALNGPPSNQSVSIQFSTTGFGTPDGGSWSLSYDTASLDLQYSYSSGSSDPSGPTDPPPPDPPPPAVPEPGMLWPMALALPLMIWGQRRYVARRELRSGITLE
jgi:hypothetical protein